MSKNTFLIISWCIIAVLLAFLFWPDKQHNLHEDHHADVIVEYDTIKAHDALSAHVIDSLNKTISGKDSAIKSLKAGQASTRKQLDLKTAQVTQLVAEIREYNKDTGFFGHLLDSLKEQAVNLAYLVAQYEEYSDSINKENDSLRVALNTKDSEKDKRLTEVKAAYDKLLKAYTELFGTTRGLLKDLKRQKLKTKIAGVLGAAGVVLALIK